MRKVLQKWKLTTKNVSLRDYPVPLHEKRRLREEELELIRNSNTKFWGPWSTCGECLCVRSTLDRLHQVARAFKLWERALIAISGRFGSGISSYFSFLRFLLLLNLVSSVFIFGMLVVPTLFFTKDDVHQAPPGSDDPCISPSNNTESEGIFIDLFTGQGFLRDSILFYGHYFKGTTDGSSFNIRLVYLLVPLVYLLLCGLYLMRRTAQGIATRRVRSRDYKTRISTKVFSSWDFCAQGVGMSLLKQQSLSNEIKSHLAEELWLLNLEGLSLGRRVHIIFSRVLINSVILALLGCAFYSVHLAAVVSQDYQGITPILALFTQYLVPIVISLVLILLPPIFMLLVKLEGHSPSAELTLTLIRCVFLRLGTLGIFFFSLGQKILCYGSEETSCNVCGHNTQFKCWETSVGQEFYKLSVFHFLHLTMDFLLLQAPRSFLVSRVKWRVVVWLGKEKFSLPQNVLDTVYGQTLVWGGLFYAPLLPLLNIVFIFLTFHIKKFSLYRLCDASQKLVRVSTSRILFYFVLLLGLMTTFFPLIYMVTSVRPSRACGLFTDYSTTWEYVQNSTRSAMAIKDLSYVTSDLFPFCLLGIFSIMLTSYISRVRQYEHIIEELKDHLTYQIQDKIFLVRTLKEADDAPGQEMDHQEHQSDTP
uniref:Transmembrane channel-like protein n=1 Tax=Leptobrachium leishanense TaxID=445787 RepID=A0A8C5WKJ0_9ANUR